MPLLSPSTLGVRRLAHPKMFADTDPFQFSVGSVLKDQAVIT